MAHVAVVRRNISPEQWARVNFDKYEELIIRETWPTGSWSVREGEYYPDGYTWHGPRRTIVHGDRWGGPDVTARFEGRAVIPPELEGHPVYFQMLTPTEVIVSSEGRMLDGLDPNRMNFLLAEKGETGREYSFVMEAYTRSKPDDDRNPRAAAMRGCVQRFNSPVLAVIDKEAQELSYDLEVLYMTAFGYAVKDDMKEYLQKKVSLLLRLMPPLNSCKEEKRAALPALRKFLAEEVYNGSHPFAKEGRLACIAHSHLDIAYFWRTKQTVQKNARTVLIQLNLMDRHDEFCYAHSQAWTYEMLERYYPELFERVRQRIAEGRWEIVGAMYVEPDCNVVSAESLIRQILMGKKYFLDKFGVDVKNCWLPDVFGNSGILPQILKKSGVPYFVSNKMSTWNDTNRFPHNHFLWRGHDGSDVYACVPPVHFINWMDPNQATEHWEALQDKDTVAESLHMYGYGDGGSGATDEMLEFHNRQQKLPGIPQQRLTTGQEFLERNFTDKTPLPLWQGDLYLEMHRGTFTNKAILKKSNRRGEFALKETETLCAAAARTGQSYPREELERLWKILLLNQFHDILPGTHVAPVTKDCMNDYGELFGSLEKMKRKSLEALTVADGKSAWVFNSDCNPARGLAYCEEKISASVPFQVQTGPDGSTRTVVETGLIAPYGSLDLEQNGEEASVEENTGLKASLSELESPWFKIQFGHDGEISRIFDKTHNRNLAAEGKILNEWQLFEDTPGRYNAWDILDRFEDRPVDCGSWEKTQVMETGPLSAALCRERIFRSSRAVQVIRVFARENRIDFETFIDWQEREKLLKVSFPLDIRSPRFTCDNSAGVTSYENHRNTSWQEARFEVPCHKWVDMSEGLFGVSLLNDSKYGVDVSEGRIRLSLLRSSIRPDTNSDRGTHLFTYSLTTHDGQWQNSRLMEHARTLNDPLRLYPGRKSADVYTPVLLVEPTGRLSSLALKEDEKGKGDLIFRAVEYTGTAGTFTVKLDKRVLKVYQTDLMENNEWELPVRDSAVSLKVGANEIVTLRLCE